MGFRFRKIDMNDSIPFRNTGLIGIDLYFDPMELDIHSFGRLRKIYIDCFGTAFVDTQLKRVGKLYSLLISGKYEDEKHSYFKQVYMIAENESMAILNVKSDDPIIKFVANVVVQFSEVKK